MTLRIVGVASEPRLKAPYLECLKDGDVLFQVCQVKDFVPAPNSRTVIHGGPMPGPEEKALVLKTPSSPNNVEIICLRNECIDTLIEALQGLREVR